MVPGRNTASLFKVKFYAAQIIKLLKEDMTKIQVYHIKYSKSI